MEFISAEKTAAECSGFTKITGTYSRCKGDPIRISFVYASALDEWVSSGTECWFLLGITSAFVLGEPYTHRGAVDDNLVLNGRALVRQWSSFYRGRSVPAIEVDVRPSVARPRDQLTACLFTGGVDSSFTLARNFDEIDVLMHARFNFDGPDDYSFIERENTAYSADFARLGKTPAIIGTNILWPFEGFAEAWSYLTHGAALTAMGHLFSPRIGKLLISSSHAYGELIPWGSHPLTDPLLSSSTMDVVHFGTAYTRFMKVEGLARHPALLNRLEVCGRLPKDKLGRLNCSRCQKCLRTMAALDLCGVQKTAGSSPFEWSDYSPRALARIRLHHPNEYIFFHELIDAGRRAGRHDIADAASEAVKRSKKFKPLVFVENLLRRRFASIARLRFLKTAKRRFYRAFG